MSAVCRDKLINFLNWSCAHFASETIVVSPTILLIGYIQTCDRRGNSVCKDHTFEINKIMITLVLYVCDYLE